MNIHTRALLLGAIVLTLTPLSLLAQPLADHPRIAQALELARQWLDAQRAYEQIPGLSVAIISDQETIWSGGMGYADLSRRTPATATTIYSICSISKLFTAVAVMQLRDEGALRLDDPVSRHLPWFTITQSAPESAEITVEGLLTHSAGLPRESDYPYWTGPSYSFPTREQIIERLSSQRTLYPAETYFQYSNLGLSLAGEVVAAASGRPFAEYVEQNIVNPLGLKNTTTEMPERERGRALATGYSAITREGKRQVVPFFQARGIAPAAGFASTAEDLGRFAAWQFRLLSQGGTEILKATTLRQMHRVNWMEPDFETTWGLGFAVWRADNKTFVGHGGSCPGYRTQLLLQPNEKIGVVFMANAQGVNANQFAQKLYDIMEPAIKAARADTARTYNVPDRLSVYSGSYESGFAGEILVLPWEDGLATLFLPTMEPVRNLSKLRKVGEHTFRRVRKDGALGEEIVFEMGADGRPMRMVWHSNHYQRVR